MLPISTLNTHVWNAHFFWSCNTNRIVSLSCASTAWNYTIPSLHQGQSSNPKNLFVLSSHRASQSRERVCTKGVNNDNSIHSYNFITSLCKYNSTWFNSNTTWGILDMVMGQSTVNYLTLYTSHMESVHGAEDCFSRVCFII